MKFENNEFTNVMLLKKIQKEIKHKVNGKPFTMNDIRQYMFLGKIPLAYGGQYILNRKYRGFKYLLLLDRIEDEFIQL